MYNLQILYVSPKLGAKQWPLIHRNTVLAVENGGNVGGPVVGVVKIDLRYPRAN